jgi:cytochrome o ubiquinol oxidase subunit 2
MNAFFIPQLGGMIATMNRMVTQLHLEADRPGDYYGESTQFSGDGFSDMNFVVRAVPSDAFARWIGTVREKGPELNSSSYTQLARQSQRVPPFTYRSADSGLFQAIVNQQVAPGPGPNTGADSPEVRSRGAR